MGRQVTFINSEQDEADFIEWVNRRHDLRCLPKIMDTRPTEVLKLGVCESRKQKIFLAEYSELALELVTEVGMPGWKPAEGPTRYHISPVLGGAVYIEWLRTPKLESHEYCSHGRFYFSPGRDHLDKSKRMGNLANSFFRYVRTRYPSRVKTDYRNKTFVGPRLTEDLEKGKASILWRGGKPLEIESNPSYKMPKA